ncbi:MAG: M14 family metallopeptidase [Pyrinomonadaceae bacterium]
MKVSESRKLLSAFLLLLVFTFGAIAQDKPKFQGQPPIKGDVDTTDHEIEKQERKVFSFPEDGVYFSNKFAGARLNEVTKTAENKYTILIKPENSPINMSPWYAFQVWANKKKEIEVKMTYAGEAAHRYNPKISKDGNKWKALESSRIIEEEKGTADFGPDSLPKRAILKLKIGKKPLWVSAQELEDSARVYKWMEKMAKKPFIDVWTFAKSKEGRDMKMMRIGDADSKNMVMVISRQHPPEVTGYFAMQAFVEKLADKSTLSKTFRKDWAIYVVPLMNPDGVDEGHWRHNAGGIDLNRDWTVFNQPEDLAVSNFLKEREAATGGKFYFGIDFHSTWDDIYYPMAKEYKGNMPDLVYDWLDAIKKAIPNYEPNIRASDKAKPAIVSRNYFYFSHGMEAIVFEIGDNTSREFIKKKGTVGAEQLMKLMLARMNTKANAASNAGN